MRTPFVAGNWKMYNSISEARKFVAELVPEIREIKDVDKVLCPPFIDLLVVSSLIEGTDIGLGAQNMHWETKGAFTGEISPAMLTEICQYVILGHSERRAYFCETDEGVNRKIKSALAANLVPIVCVGETFEQNEAGKTNQVVSGQVYAGLQGIEITSGNQLVIAYEPIWAIGTGKAATPEGANKVIADVIRKPLAELFGPTLSEEIRVLYGGSVKPQNAADFFYQPDIDGGLVGGACLKVEDFTKIIEAATR